MPFKRGQLVRIARLHSNRIDGTGTIVDEMPSRDKKYKVRTGDLVLWIEEDRLKDERQAIEEGRAGYKEEDKERQKKAFDVEAWKKKWE